MTSPVSIGDAITIVTQICHLYDAYRWTPEKLRQMMRGFEDVERELETLNSVLASSRRAQHRTYPYTAALVSDLSKARDYFQRFEPLVDEKGRVSMIAKVRGVMRAKWDDGKVQTHVARMNVHRENMKDFKQTVLIQAAQDNIELQIGAIQLQLRRIAGVSPRDSLPTNAHDDASSTSSDRMSILTRASKSLSMADRLQSAPARQPLVELSSILESDIPGPTGSQSSTCDLKDTIAEYVERNELYIPGTLQDAKLQELRYVAELPERWLQLQRDGPSQQLHHEMQTSNRPATVRSVKLSDASSPHSSNTTAPAVNGILEDANFSPVSVLTDSPDISSDHGRLKPLQQMRSTPDILSNLEISSVGDIVSLNGSDIQDDRLVLRDSVMLFTPWTKNTPVPCTLTLIQSPGSLSLRSTTRQTFHSSAMSALSSGSDIPLSSIISRHSSISTVASVTETQPLVFDHAVLGGMRSFPRILHPRVESNATQTHPFSIEFYTHQFLSLRGDDQREKAVKGVAYQFRTKQDRDLVRARIFGKTLLAVTGIATIQFDKSVTVKPCGTEAISLWTTREANTENLTITVQCSSRGKPEPDCAQEFIVLDAKGLKKVRDEQNKELNLTIQPTPPLPLSPDDATVVNCSSDASGGLSSSNASGASCHSEIGTSPQSRRSSIFSNRRLSISSGATSDVRPQDTRPFHCFIKFTEGADGLTSSKKKFLNALQAHLPR